MAGERPPSMSVYAVASGKGGVGKTTTAAALGACVAATGRSVVVVDADLGMADLGSVLEVPDGGPTLHDALAGEADASEAVYGVAGGFDVVPGGRELVDYAAGDPAGLRDVVGTLAESHDVVVLDTAAGLSQDVLVPVGLADEVVLVSTPDRAAVRDTEKTRQLVDRVDGTVAGLVLTRVVDAGRDPPADIPVRLLGMVSEDDAVAGAERAGVAVPVHDPEGPAATAYAEVAAALLGVAVGDVVLGPDRGEGGAGGDSPLAAGLTGQASGSASASGADTGGGAEDPTGPGQDGGGDGSTPETAGTVTGTGGESGPGTAAGDGDRDVGGDGDGTETRADPDEEGSRSLLSRLTGGLLG